MGRVMRVFLLFPVLLAGVAVAQKPAFVDDRIGPLRLGQHAAVADDRHRLYLFNDGD